MAGAGFYRLEAKIVQRSAGHSATAKAAYISRSQVYDARTGETFDYTRHGNQALFSGFYTPQNAQEWAQERESFWNAVEAREKRKDSQLAKEYVAAYPHQMSLEHVRYAAQDFIKENFTRKGFAADMAIHAAHDHGDERNAHLHILVPMRQLDKNGEWAAKKQQFAKDPTTGRYGADADELKHLRERFAHHLNRQLERFGYDIRVDHRSNEERGLDAEPTLHLGKRDAAKERTGEPTKRGDINREIKARNDERAHTRREIETLSREQYYDYKWHDPSQLPPSDRPGNDNVRGETPPGVAPLYTVEQRHLYRSWRNVVESGHDIAWAALHLTIDALPLVPEQKEALWREAGKDWAEVEPLMIARGFFPKDPQDREGRKHGAPLPRNDNLTIEDTLYFAWRNAEQDRHIVAWIQEGEVEPTEKNAAYARMLKSRTALHEAINELPLEPAQKEALWRETGKGWAEVEPMMIAQGLFPEQSPQPRPDNDNVRSARFAESRQAYIEQRRAQLAGNTTVQEIGLAYTQTRTGEEFVAVLEERALTLCLVTEEDAERSKTQRDWLGETPRYEPGAYLVLNERGHAFRLDATTIHDHEENIFARLAEIDASQQLTLSQARQVVEYQREVSEPAREAPAVQRVQETAGRVADAAGMVTGIAGTYLGGAVRITENVLGALSDFFTGGSAPAARPAPQREAPPARETTMTPQQRETLRRTTPEVAVRDPEVQQQVRAGNVTNMPIEIQEAIRRRAREIEEQRRDRDRGRER